MGKNCYKHSYKQAHWTHQNYTAFGMNNFHSFVIVKNFYTCHHTWYGSILLCYWYVCVLHPHSMRSLQQGLFAVQGCSFYRNYRNTFKAKSCLWRLFFLPCSLCLTIQHLLLLRLRPPFFFSPSSLRRSVRNEAPIICNLPPALSWIPFYALRPSQA